MLTIDKVRLYKHYGGDLDILARVSNKKDPVDITEDDWRLIDELRQGLLLISSGLASPEFAAAIENKLATSITDDQTLQALRELA